MSLRRRDREEEKRENSPADWPERQDDQRTWAKVPHKRRIKKIAACIAARGDLKVRINSDDTSRSNPVS
jgi:hypothetical protein